MTTSLAEAYPTGSARRAVVALLMWFGASVLSAIGLLALQPLTGIDMEALSIVMIAPAVGAIVAWAVIPRGMPIFPAAAPASTFAISVVLAVLAVIAYFVVVSVVRGGIPVVPGRVAGVPVLAVVAAQVFGALCEEIGFRGLLLHTLNRWLSWPVAAVLTGVTFGIWHVQYYGLPPLEFLAFILGSVALTVTMAAVMIGAFWQRMTLCTIMHAGANLALAFTGGDEVSLTIFAVAVTIGAVAIVPVALAVRRRRPVSSARGGGGVLA